MHVLLTGAFGNVGQNTLEALMARGHRVRTFDLDTPANQKAARAFARRYGERLETVWGDLRRLEDLENAARGIEGAIHLGFVIPTLSATGTGSEQRPAWAREINVGGTRNLARALEKTARPNAVPPRLVFASSLHIYGKTQHLPPPRTVDETPRPVEHYARHKVEAEHIVRSSDLCWSILRLGAALPLRLIVDPGMFDVPLNNRIEFVHTRDAGDAFAAAVDHPSVWGRTLHIGGGERCQLIYRDLMAQVLGAVGIGALPDWAFSTEPFATDWLDTRESQALLHFQKRTLDDYTQEVKNKLGALRGLAVAFRPLARRWLLAQSPYRPSRPARVVKPAG